MKIDEARRTGIDIGEGNQQNGGLVYEIAIKFKAAPCLAGLKQGDVIGVGIITGTAGWEKHKEKRPNFQMGGPGLSLGGPPGGGMGGHGSGGMGGVARHDPGPETGTGHSISG